MCLPEHMRPAQRSGRGLCAQDGQKAEHTQAAEAVAAPMANHLPSLEPEGRRHFQDWAAEAGGSPHRWAPASTSAMQALPEVTFLSSAAALYLLRRPTAATMPVLQCPEPSLNPGARGTPITGLLRLQAGPSTVVHQQLPAPACELQVSAVSVGHQHSQCPWHVARPGHPSVPAAIDVPDSLFICR